MSNAAGPAVLVLSIGGILSAIVYWYARSRGHEDVRARQVRVELQASEQRLRAFLDHAAAVIYMKDTRGRYLFINRHYERLLGVTDEQARGRVDHDLFPPGAADRFRENDHRVLASGEMLEVEEVVPQADGPHTYWSIKFPLDDPDGNRSAVGGISTDITESKRTQARLQQRTAALEEANRELLHKEIALQQSVAELEHSNKELDDFAYIASHDLREPLRGIHNFATFLLEDYGDKLDADGQAKLQTLTRLSQRLENLIDALLHFSRLGRLDPVIEDTDLDEVVDTVLDSLHVTLGERGIEVRRPHPLPTIRCDRVRVSEVFQNLISNASKYNDKPDKWVEIGWDDGGEPGGRAVPGQIVFYIRDNGIGIPAKHREAIFRIFKRLHARDQFGGGIGAGLTIVKKIIERQGGTVWIESEEGVGTTFRFTLQGEAMHERHDRSRQERYSLG